MFYFKSIKVSLNAKSNRLIELKSVYDSFYVKSKGKMPNFLVQKMENLLKRWTDIELTSTNNTNYNNADNTNDIINSQHEQLPQNFNFAQPKASSPEFPPMPPKSLPEKLPSPTYSSPYSSSQTSSAHTSPQQNPIGELFRSEQSSNSIRDKIDQVSHSSSSSLSKIVRTTTTETTTILKTKIDEGNKSNLSDELQEQFEEKEIVQTTTISFEKNSDNDIHTDKDKSSSSTSIKEMTKFRKTASIDSIKSKTIVTPIELEKLEKSNRDNTIEDEYDEDEDIAKQLNIIKLENEPTVMDKQNFDHFTNLVSIDDKNKLNNDRVDSIESENNLSQNERSIISSKSSKDDIELISNDLFDWLLWIDHTLESQVITVGDLDEIQQSVNKYTVRTLLFYFL